MVGTNGVDYLSRLYDQANKLDNLIKESHREDPQYIGKQSGTWHKESQHRVCFADV